MTREETIERLKSIKSLVDKYDNVVALREAIKALEQEPCKDTNANQHKNALEGDAISRQAVLDMMQMRLSGKELYKAVYELPSVNPQPKTGHWIETWTGLWCSECNKDVNSFYNYCPNCGAKMESEDKV